MVLEVFVGNGTKTLRLLNEYTVQHPRQPTVHLSLCSLLDSRDPQLPQRRAMPCTRC